MRLLCFADLQAHCSIARCFHDPTLPLQRWRVQKFFQLLIELKETHRCDGLLDLGDTLDDRRSVSLPTLHTVLEGLQPFKGGYNLRVNGNHDLHSKSNSVHNGHMFDAIFDTEPGVGARVLPDGSGVMVLSSYTQDGAALAESLRAIADSHPVRTPMFFGGHLTVRGAKLPGGVDAEGGIVTSLFDDYDVALLGDIHLPQQIGNAHYVGSPFQQDFGEANQQKRVGMLDTILQTVEWVPVTGFPVHRVVSADAFSLMDHSYVSTTEDRLRVVLDNAEQAERFYAHRYAHRVEPVYAFTRQEETPVEAPATPVDWSLQAAVARYVETNSPASRGINISSGDLTDFGVSIAGS